MSIANPYEILCYGDSNTYGTVARWSKEDLSARYDRNTRWPCVLQNELGEKYKVIEEGLPGRTTIYTAQPQNPHKNGLYMLEGILATHKPLDLIIILLGPNDLEMSEKLPEEDLGKGIRKLVEILSTRTDVGRDGKAPEILILAPTALVPSAPEGRTEVYDQFFGEYGVRLSKMYPEIYQKVAEELGVHYLNAQEYAKPDPGDGDHITRDSHIRLGKVLAKKVREIQAGPVA